MKKYWKISFYRIFPFVYKILRFTYGQFVVILTYTPEMHHERIPVSTFVDVTSLNTGAAPSRIECHRLRHKQNAFTQLGVGHAARQPWGDVDRHQRGTQLLQWVRQYHL